MKLVYLPLLLLTLSANESAFAKEAVRKDWKKMENIHGWSMQHPASWHWEKSDGVPVDRDDMAALLLHEGSDPKTKRGSGVIVESKGPREFKYPLKDMMEDKHGSSPAVRGEEGHETRIDGFPAYDEVVVTRGPFDEKMHFSREIYVNKGGNLFIIKYGEHVAEEGIPKKDWKNEAVFNEMLSTFKFIPEKP